LVFYIWVKSKVIENLFSYISGYADYLPFALFLLFIGKLRSEKGLWIIFAYCSVSILGDLLFTTLESLPPDASRYYNSFLTFFEYICFSGFIWLSVRNKIMRRIILLFSLAFITFLAFYFFTAKRSRIDSIPIGVETLLILSFSFYLLFEMSNLIKDSYINYNYRFWVVIGFMLYLSGSFFIYLYANQLAPGEGRKFAVLIDIFYILKNIFFAIAMIICYRQPKPKNPPSSIPFLDLDVR
jgi:hypothetical protein